MFKRILLTLLIIFLIGGAGYGGYYYANYQDKNQQNSAKDTTNTATPVGERSADGSLQAEANIDNSTHFVKRSGFPYDLGGKKKVIINLGLPDIAQGVAVASGNNNRGQEQHYTDKYNDELARWDIGYPAHEQSSLSQISVVAVSKSWLELTQQNNHAFDDTAQKLDTPAQKAAYVNKLKTESESCVKDKAKGFVTADNVFKVCFSLIPGADTYNPVLVLRGTAQVEEQTLLLVGFIRLEEGSGYDEQTGKKLLAEAKANRVPEPTIKLINTFINSLAKTTLTLESN